MQTTNRKLSNLTSSQVCEVLDSLKELYPDAECALDHGSVYQLVVAVSLSAQTTDKSVNKVTPALFAKYPDPFAIVNVGDDEKVTAQIEDIIRQIGMYKTKARNVVKLSRMLVEDFGGVVPQSMELLQKLPGVGRKTANVVLAVGFGEQRMPVDTHVLRVSHRIGLVSADAAGEKDPAATEEVLLKVIPNDRLTEAHHSIIFHGRNLCSARKPKCTECPINHICKKNNIEL